MEQVQSEPRQMKRRKTFEDPPSGTLDGSANEARGEAVLEAKHKVFLSHSGAQKNFVEQVCVDLERCDRYPFFDKRRHSLGIGQNFPEVIFEAIRQCQVGVLILCEEFFTRTKWPMLELAAMVESKNHNSKLVIMPVFLDISREQCRNVENHKRWERVWLTWKQTDPRIDVEKWMQALSIFGPTNGLIYKEVLGEVKFREEIVEAICGGVPPESRWDDSHVQGRSRLCQVIREKVESTEVNKSFGVRVIGVYGVGGLGKTTMCKTLCNDYGKEFQDKVAHVEFGNNGKVELMRGVLRKLTNTSPEVLAGFDEGECTTHLKAKLHQHKVILAIDNVCDINEAIEQARVYLRVGFKDGSVVIITSRSMEVLKGVGVAVEDCVKMPKLDATEARLLFLSQVPGLPVEIKAEDEAFILQCVEHCRFREGDDNGLVYLPLALKLLGVESSRRGYDPKGWVEDMPHTSNNVMDCVFDILRRSFNALRDDEKHLFMDVVLYYPWNIMEALEFRRFVTIFEWLSMVHQNSVEWVKSKFLELKRKSVIEDVYYGVGGRKWRHDFIGIHDLWREFAIKETRGGEVELRRWVYVVDDEKSGFDDVEPCGNRWGKLSRMRFLRSEGPDSKLSNLTMLMKLEYCSNISVLHLMNVTDMEKVEVLDLTPLKCLKSLVLDGFKDQILGRYSKFRKYVPMVEVRGLRTLKSLALLVWRDDYSFSTSMEDIAYLTSLEYLGLSCSKYEKLPDLSNLLLLRVVHFDMDIDKCELHGLSSKMIRLRRLFLNFSYKTKKPCLCYGISNLMALEELDIKYVKVEEVFDLQRLTNLQKLTIHNCQSMKVLRGVDNLVEFTITDSLSSVQILPSFWKLTNLQNLHVLFGKSITTLEGLSDAISLQELHIYDCPNLRIIPYLGRLTNLEVFYIVRCPVQTLPGLGELVGLGVLAVWECNKLSEIPDLHKLSNLNILGLTWCALKTVRGLEGLKALETLSLEGCRELVVLPNLCMLRKLEDLNIMGCSSLESLPSIESLSNLNIMGCSSLESLPYMESLSNLKELRVDWRLVLFEWHKLPARVDKLKIDGSGSVDLSEDSEELSEDSEELSEDSEELSEDSEELSEDSEDSEELSEDSEELSEDCEELSEDSEELSEDSESRGNCKDLIDESSLPTLPSVYTLCLRECNFGVVSGLINCSALRELEIKSCYEVEGLPDLPKLRKLQIKSSEAKEAISMGFFPQLKRLEFHDLALTELPDLSICFPNLVSLHVSYCDELASVKSSGPLTALKVFDVSFCRSLRCIPDLRLSTRLKSLEVHDCGIRLTKSHPSNRNELSWPNVEWEVLP